MFTSNSTIPIFNKPDLRQDLETYLEIVQDYTQQTKNGLKNIAQEKPSVIIRPNKSVNYQSAYDLSQSTTSLMKNTAFNANLINNSNQKQDQSMKTSMTLLSPTGPKASKTHRNSVKSIDYNSSTAALQAMSSMYFDQPGEPVKDKHLRKITSNR